MKKGQKVRNKFEVKHRLNAAHSLYYKQYEKVALAIGWVHDRRAGSWAHGVCRSGAEFFGDVYCTCE